MQELGPRAKDLTGQRFDRLYIIEFAGRDCKKRLLWKCRCDCGKETIVLANKIFTGRTKSCGCLRGELSRKRATKHGMYRTRLYNIWANMIQRCKNPKSVSYQYYGKRGIKVCEEWEKFSNFADWALNHGYSEELSIDRIDPDKDYEPDNCRWADAIEQGNNKRNNVMVEHNGRMYTAAEISRATGNSYSAIISRIKRGWSSQQIFEKGK